MKNIIFDFRPAEYGCHEGSAIFRCAEKDVTVCERCYARMVREWNEEKGVN